ncbi:hypothetical protein, partial [Moorena bouillonii]|uniref:hypothetical protein n=1 Tax=Moorena bouillonii TaxID=207920 RepID=UPI0013010652
LPISLSPYLPISLSPHLPISLSPYPSNLLFLNATRYKRSLMVLVAAIGGNHSSRLRFYRLLNLSTDGYIGGSKVHKTLHQGDMSPTA